MGAPTALVLARGAFFASAMILFGTRLFPLYADLKPPAESLASRRVALGLSGISLIAAVAWLLALAHNLDRTRAVLSVARIILLETTFGGPWMARLAFAAATVLAAFCRWPRALLIASCGEVICEAWDGHAVVHGAIGEIGQAAHTLGAATWVGGLAALAARLARLRASGSSREAFELLRRFSNAALAAVLAILSTGALNVYLIGSRFNWTSRYAHVLEIKVSLVAIMLALALANRAGLTPAFRRQDDAATLKRIFAAVLVELGLGVGVMFAAALLGELNPYMMGR